MWEFWRRHKRKVYVTLGVLGSGYLLYKMYDGHKRRLTDLERQLSEKQEHDELIKFQMQTHFENVQRIADITTLPHVMLYLSSRIAEELDLTYVMERLVKGKDQPNTLTSSEKLELWERLKILSFTKLVLSLWATTMLSLYIKVQVNILGRHLYIDTARDLGTSYLHEADRIDRNDQQQFLTSADFLSNYGMPSLISDVQVAVSEVLKAKQLKDVFHTTLLHETIIQVLDTFMSLRRTHHWVDYMIPADTGVYKLTSSSSTYGTDSAPKTKYDQLMAEARTVLSSAEFGNIVDVSLRTAVSALIEDIKLQFAEDKLLLGMPLAKILPRVAQMSQLLLEESSRNRYVKVIQKIPEVEIFFTLLYSSTTS